MKGYWHFVALSISISILTLIFENYFFAVFYLIWLCYLYYTKRLGRHPLIVSLICFLLFLIYIPSPVQVLAVDLPPSHDKPLTGKIISPVSIKQNKVEFTLQEEHSKTKILIIYFPQTEEFNTEDYSKLKYGAHCTVQGQLEIPEQRTNPGQFDYQAYLANQGIAYQLIVKSLDDILSEGSSYFHILHQNRFFLINYINEHINVETAAWINALVLGDDSYLPKETIELFQRWGLSHLLAISGLHVGLIVSIVYFLLVKLTNITREQAQWLMVIFLPIYALIAGGAPSVWRASLMVVLFIVLQKTKLKLSVTDTLSLVFIALIVFNKYIVYHVGFQLSFTVTLGLILSSRLLANTTSRFYQMLYISFISQMMILPLQLAYFSTFQPLSILLNILVVPYFSLFVIPLMFLIVIMSPLLGFFINFIANIFNDIHHIFLTFLYWVDSVADYPLIIGDIPLVVSIFYYMFFLMFMINLEQRKFKQTVRYGAMIIIVIIVLSLRPYLSSEGKITMLDVGQGDAIIIELPYRKGVFVIDAGSGFSYDDFGPSKTIYQQIIKPYLYSQSISKIDAILLSHEHLDHIGSVSYILEDFDVSEIIISEYYELNDFFQESWEQYNVPIKRVNLGEEININGQIFHVLSPEKDVDANENSLVLYTRLDDLYWLFTGDIYKSTEKDIISRYNTLSVDVLKVAHHGSNTSTDESFLHHIDPTYALIPVGRNNRYSHPDGDVINLLEDTNVTILRTDEDGAIQYKYKENKQGLFFKYLP